MNWTWALIGVAAVAGTSIAQTDNFDWGGYIQRSYSSRWTTTVVYAGDSTCQHEWVKKKEALYGIRSVCGVLHDERGCPDNWIKREKICSKCLRKEIEQEERYFTNEQLEEKRDVYGELQKRLDSLIGKK